MSAAPDSQYFQGKNADPNFRSERARRAATVRNSLDARIDALVRDAPKLSDDQRSRLAAILRPTGDSR